jgi:hypothetical protein
LTIASGPLALMTVGCNAIVGISAYEKSDATCPTCPVADAGSPADTGPPKPVDASAALDWAAWRMPNGAGLGPNPTVYTAAKEGSLEIVTDAVTKLVWERNVAATPVSYAAAANQCAGFGKGWRLPTKIELVSLLDFGRLTSSAPYIGEVAFPSTPAGQYWTTSRVRAPVGASAYWSVDFATGEVSTMGSNSARHARCVRSP